MSMTKEVQSCLKIKITYLPSEEKGAWVIGNFVALMLRKMTRNNPKIKEREEHPPYRHIYISSKPPADRE